MLQPLGPRQVGGATGAHEEHRADPVAVEQGHLERDHPAHRAADERHGALRAQRIEQLEEGAHLDLVERLHPPRRVLEVRRVAEADHVGRDAVVAVAELLDDGLPVGRAGGPRAGAVEEEQGGHPRLARGVDAIAHLAQ
nr:hypothetical protein [Janibacter anophelis]